MRVVEARCRVGLVATAAAASAADKLNCCGTAAVIDEVIRIRAKLARTWTEGVMPC